MKNLIKMNLNFLIKPYLSKINLTLDLEILTVKGIPPPLFLKLPYQMTCFHKLMYKIIFLLFYFIFFYIFRELNIVVL